MRCIFIHYIINRMSYLIYTFKCKITELLKSLQHNAAEFFLLCTYLCVYLYVLHVFLHATDYNM